MATYTLVPYSQWQLMGISVGMVLARNNDFKCRFIDFDLMKSSGDDRGWHRRKNMTKLRSLEAMIGPKSWLLLQTPRTEQSLLEQDRFLPPLSIDTTLIKSSKEQNTRKNGSQICHTPHCIAGVYTQPRLKD